MQKSSTWLLAIATETIATTKRDKHFIGQIVENKEEWALMPYGPYSPLFLF